MSEWWRSIIGRLEDELDRLARPRIVRYLEASDERGRGREAYVARVGIDLLPPPPPHGNRVAVRIRRRALEAHRLAGMRGDARAPPHRHPGFVIGTGVRRGHRPLHARREPEIGRASCRER